jgi:drug/metabolite transporter (DMT)-like permease
MWVHVAVNVVTQFVCLCGVYTLIGLTDQLTVNVALTVRKFFSLLLSIWLFNNTFTWLHWLGALCVIFGTALYQGLFGKDIFREPSCAAAISPPSTPEGAKRSA